MKFRRRELSAEQAKTMLEREHKKARKEVDKLESELQLARERFASISLRRRWLHMGLEAEK